MTSSLLNLSSSNRLHRAAVILSFLLAIGISTYQPSDAQALLASDAFHILYRRVETPSLASLHEALLTDGPIDPHGIRRYAVTRWTIRWNYVLNREQAISGINVQTAIEVELPEWHPTEKLPLEDFHRWRSVYTKLLFHERAHAERARSTAASIERVIGRKIRAGMTSALHLNRIIRAKIRENNRWDVEFDEATMHGKVDGIDLATPSR